MNICFKMDFLCFQVSFGLIVLGLPLRCVGESVKIGIIEHGARREETENIVDGGLTVTLQTYYINVTDSFQVFKTVRLLEDSLDIEFIVIVYNELLALSNPLITITENKPVVLWGDKPSYSLKNIRHYDTATTEHYETCQMIEPKVVGSSRAYCVEHLYDVTRTSNGTRIDKVPLDAPNILASLIIKQLSWKQVIIFHENSTEGKVSVLVDILSQRGVLFVLYNLDRLSSLTGVLSETYNKTLSLTTEIHYVVMCEFGCLRRLFKAANDFDIDNRNKTLIKQFSQWLVVSYDHSNIVSETLNTCAGQLDNVAIIPIPEVKTDGSRKVFYESIREALFRKQHDFSNTSLVDAVLNTVKQKSTVWHPVLRECEALRIETLMYTSRGRHFDLVGYVSMETGDILVLSDLFPNTKYGYNKRKFLVSTLHYPPFVIKRENNGTVIYEGMCHDLLAELARTLNFTYDLTEPDDRKWGSPDSNLTFNGMIGQLQREEVDIVAADISIQKEREMVMDFAFPFYYGDTSVLLKKPDPNEGKWRTLVDPFKWRVLVAIGAMLPFASLLAFLLERFNPFFDHPDNAHLPKNCGLKTYIDSFWYMYGALLCQGGVNLPESFAGRTFVSSWWIFSIIIVGIYCGNLIAFLTLSKDKPPFNTLEEMAELSNTYKWGTQAGTHWEFVFVTSNTDEFRKVGDLMIEFNRSDPSVMSVDIDVHLAKVKKGGYGWIGDTVIIEVEIAKNCELMMIKERFLPLKYAFGFTNNSPHTRIFSEQMLSIHESGLLQVWKRKWWPKNSICSGDILPEAKPIKLVDVQSAFYVAAGGIVLGFLAFVSEIFVKRIRKESSTDRQSHITMVSVSNSCEDG